MKLCERITGEGGDYQVKIPPVSRRSMKKSSIATYSGLRLDLQKGESLIAPGSHRAERGRIRGGGGGGRVGEGLGGGHHTCGIHKAKSLRVCA